MSFRIACCISGYPTPSVITHISRLAKLSSSLDFFIFFWDTINPEIKKQVNDILKPKDIKYQEPIHFKYDAVFKEPDKQEHKNNAFSMFYGISQVQKMRKQYEQRMNKNYDLVIRFRYDLYFIDNFSDIIVNVKRYLDDKTVVFPNDHHHIGICDQLWFGKSNIMDQFILLSDWIRDNINNLFFVNESVLYNFVISRKINIKCIPIRYILLREHLIYVPSNFLYDEYVRQQTEPWISPCPEKKDGLYQIYMANRNLSASNIYFFTKQCYCEIPCKILNISRNRYLYVMNDLLNQVPNRITSNRIMPNPSINKMNSNKLSSNVVSLNNFYTVCKIRIFNAYLINIFIDVQTKEKDKQYCLAVHDNQLICSTNPNNISAQFFLLKKDNVYQIMYHRYSNTNRLCQISNYNFYLYADRTNNILTNGEPHMRETEWLINPL